MHRRACSTGAVKECPAGTSVPVANFVGTDLGVLAVAFLRACLLLPLVFLFVGTAESPHDYAGVSNEFIFIGEGKVIATHRVTIISDGDQGAAPA